MKSIIVLIIGWITLGYATVDDPYPSFKDADSSRKNRVIELDAYWKELARTAKEGDFERMKALYHEDAVLVKLDTTLSITEAFKYRWKEEIMEVKNGKRINNLEFKFSKRIGNETTAFEKGIYHYTSIEAQTGKTLGDAYIQFEMLFVKVNGAWKATMEYQKKEVSLKEWDSLE